MKGELMKDNDKKNAYAVFTPVKNTTPDNQRDNRIVLTVGDIVSEHLDSE